MTLKKRYLRTVHFLFIALLLVQLLPDKLTTDTYAGYVIWFAVGVEILTLIVSALIKKPLGLTLFVDIVSFIYGLLIAWTLATAKFNLLKPSSALFCRVTCWQLPLRSFSDCCSVQANDSATSRLILQSS